MFLITKNRELKKIVTSSQLIIHSIDNVFLCCRYVGPLARDQAGEKLKRQPDGAYLVRDSENPQRKGNPALSIK